MKDKINYFVLNFLANLSLVRQNFYTARRSFVSYKRHLCISVYPIHYLALAIW
jgi:hypothetical protein